MSSNITYAEAVAKTLPPANDNFRSVSAAPPLRRGAKKTHSFAAHALPALSSPKEFPSLSSLQGRVQTEKNK